MDARILWPFQKRKFRKNLLRGLYRSEQYISLSLATSFSKLQNRTCWRAKNMLQDDEKRTPDMRASTRSSSDKISTLELPGTWGPKKAFLYRLNLTFFKNCWLQIIPSKPKKEPLVLNYYITGIQYSSGHCLTMKNNCNITTIISSASCRFYLVFSERDTQCRIYLQ